MNSIPKTATHSFPLPIRYSVTGSYKKLDIFYLTDMELGIGKDMNSAAERWLDYDKETEHNRARQEKQTKREKVVKRQSLIVKDT